MTKCNYCGGTGAIGHPAMPDPCPWCEIVTVRFTIVTEYGEWECVATKWSDGSVLVDLAQDMGSPYMRAVDEWSLVYGTDAEATPARIAQDIEARCEGNGEAWDERAWA